MATKQKQHRAKQAARSQDGLTARVGRGPVSGLATATARVKESAMPASSRDWESMPEGKEKYNRYLCSREWGVLKKAVHKRANGMCERCKVAKIDAVHHLTYERKYREHLDDLQGLCNPCHEFTHGHSDADPVVLDERWEDFYRYGRDAMKRGKWPVPWEVVSGFYEEIHPLVALVIREEFANTKYEGTIRYFTENSGNFSEFPDGLEAVFRQRHEMVQLIQDRCLRVDVLGWIESGSPPVDMESHRAFVHSELGLPLPRDVEGEWSILPMDGDAKDGSV